MVIVNWLLVNLRQIWHVWDMSKAWQYPSFCSLPKIFLLFVCSLSGFIICPRWMNSSLYIMIRSFIWTKFVKFFFFFFHFSFLRLQSGCRRLSNTGKRVLPVRNSTIIIFRIQHIQTREKKKNFENLKKKDTSIAHAFFFT
jgi:hypothetical protein